MGFSVQFKVKFGVSCFTEDRIEVGSQQEWEMVNPANEILEVVKVGRQEAKEDNRKSDGGQSGCGEIGDEQHLAAEDAESSSADEKAMGGEGAKVALNHRELSSAKQGKGTFSQGSETVAAPTALAANGADAALNSGSTAAAQTEQKAVRDIFAAAQKKQDEGRQSKKEEEEALLKAVAKYRLNAQSLNKKGKKRKDSADATDDAANLAVAAHPNRIKKQLGSRGRAGRRGRGGRGRGRTGDGGHIGRGRESGQIGCDEESGQIVCGEEDVE